jgi:hypothetical protein
MSPQHKHVSLKEDLSQIYKAAALYDSYLCNKSVFLIYCDASKRLNYEKIEFLPPNSSSISIHNATRSLAEELAAAKAAAAKPQLNQEITPICEQHTLRR